MSRIKAAYFNTSLMTAIHIDIETYCPIDLKTCGLHKYAAHPEFEVLLIAYAINNEPTRIIDMTDPKQKDELEKLKKLTIYKHVTLYAHNAEFERVCLKNILGKNLNWQCSMVKAAYCGLPLALSQLTEILQLKQEQTKKASGTALINFFSKPCKPTKANKGRTRNLPHHNPEKWEQFKQYCINDVGLEKQVINYLKAYEIPKFEKELYDIDKKINEHGVLVDIDFVKKAIKANDFAVNEILTEQKELTQLENPNSVAQLKGWLENAMQRDIDSLAKEHLKQLIDNTENNAVRTVLQNRQKLSKTSVKKYQSMINAVGEDNRARGVFQYYGANRTGRWAGRLIQLHNLPRPSINDCDLAKKLVMGEDYELLRMLYGNIPGLLSDLIRAAFMAPENSMLIVADYAAIEARVLAWLANERWRLKVFNTHGKIYEASAANMLGIPIDQVTSDLRQKGKIAELALGYQGSIGAMKQMGAEKMGLDELEIEQIVNKWRKSNPNIVSFWKNMETGAFTALRNKESTVCAPKNINFIYDGLYLRIQLPSGRELFYYKPTIATNQWGKPSIYYKGADPLTKKWEEISTYGGKLTENVVQAIARDLLAESLVRLHSKGYGIVMHVHDEVIIEKSNNFDNADFKTSLETVCFIMCANPKWAKGLPLKANGFITKYYKK